MLESCRFAIDPDNPDSGTLRTFLEISFTAISGAILWSLCYFPGLLIELTSNQIVCPSMVNTTKNEVMCSDPERYGTCIFGKLNLCTFYGLLFSCAIGCIVYSVVLLILLYRRRRTFPNWKGSLWKTLVFALVYSDENPDGLFLRVYPDDDMNDLDTDQFSQRVCCGYVAKRLFWVQFWFVITATITVILVALYAVYVAMPFGYFVNQLFPSESNVCFQLSRNMTIPECFSFELCKKRCGEDGGLATMIIGLILLLLTVTLFMMKKCLNAFKTNEEITMIRGELQPLVAQ